MVMAQSLFITLKQLHPQSQIDVLAPSWTFALLERMPQVRQGIAMSLTHGQFGFNARRQLGLELRKQQYQQAIVLPNSWKSTLTPFFAGIPKRSGYVGELRWGLLNDSRRLDKILLPMTVQRFVALAYPKQATVPPVCPSPKLLVNQQAQADTAAKFNIDRGTPIAVLCPGAEYGPAKRWPAAHFAALASALRQQNMQVWLFGSNKDKDVASEIQLLSGNACQDFTGLTTLAEAIDLMALSQVVISNDSGLMHIAAALDKKLIALYGSSDPGFTPPLQQQAQILSLNLPCAPCFKRVCPLGHTHCLSELMPERVLAALFD